MKNRCRIHYNNARARIYARPHVCPRAVFSIARDHVLFDEISYLVPILNHLEEEAEYSEQSIAQRNAALVEDIDKINAIFASYITSDDNDNDSDSDNQNKEESQY